MGMISLKPHPLQRQGNIPQCPLDNMQGGPWGQPRCFREDKYLVLVRNGTLIPSSFSLWPGHYNDLANSVSGAYLEAGT